MTNSAPFSNFKHFSSRVLFISYLSDGFTCIPIDDSISWQSISIISSATYRANNIPSICNLYKRSNVSTQFTILSTDFAALIDIFEWLLISSSTLEFSVNISEIAQDCKYLTMLNWVYVGISAFYNDSFKAKIQSPSDFWDERTFCQNITFLFSGSTFDELGAVIFHPWLPLVISVWIFSLMLLAEFEATICMLLLWLGSVVFFLSAGLVLASTIGFLFVADVS